jgi:hypothetical protein
VFVLFKKDRIPFFELELPTSEEIASLKKTRTPQKTVCIFTNLTWREKW